MINDAVRQKWPSPGTAIWVYSRGKFTAWEILDPRKEWVYIKPIRDPEFSEEELETHGPKPAGPGKWRIPSWWEPWGTSFLALQERVIEYLEQRISEIDANLAIARVEISENNGRIDQLELMIDDAQNAAEKLRGYNESIKETLDMELENKGAAEDALLYVKSHKKRYPLTCEWDRDPYTDRWDLKLWEDT